MKRQFILLVTFLLCVVASFPVSRIYAQTPAETPPIIWSDQGTAESYEAAAATGDVNATAHVANVNTNNYADTIRRIVGPVPGLTVTSMNSPLAKQMLAQSAIYNISSYIGMLYLNPPASTYAFVNDVGQTLGFVPKRIYAQGVGFSGLSALLPVWKIFRNIAYLLLAIIMVVIGFMVMFRKKIDPKTVVSIQNALPSIVMSLLLITFSYAIVGICVDIMYLLIGLIGSVFLNSGLLPSNLSTLNVLNGHLYRSVFETVPQSEILTRLISGSTEPSVLSALGSAGLFIGGLLAIATLNPLGIAAGVGLVIAGTSSLLVAALVSVALFFLFVRLFIFFISTYVKIILALIFSPFQLLMTAIPGNKAFEGWIKNLIANILIFPAATIMFLLANIFMNPGTNTQLWAPPYAAFVYNNVSIGTLLALGVLFAIPNVGKMIQDALKTKEGTSGVGIGAIGGAFGGMTQTAQQSLSTFYYLKSMKPSKVAGEEPHSKKGST